jgi:hypothetical protein
MSKKQSLELADLNIKMGIAYGVMLIVLLLVLIFWKVST